MSAPKGFIMLHYAGNENRVAISHIRRYNGWLKGTCVVFSDSEDGDVIVEETPEQIDALIAEATP